jgi:hypothetical protein
VEIFVSDISQLLAWDIYYAFNPDVVQVTGRNVHRLLEAAPSSNVFDFSDPVPNGTGLYRMAAADTGGANAAENGSGLLATITLVARQKGISWSAIYKGDVDGNGSIDIGPTLSALGGAHISDTDGDGIFDGVIRRGQIAVDTECRDPVPTPHVDSGSVVITGSTPTSTPSPSGDVTPITNTGSETPTPDPPTPPVTESPEPTRTRAVISTSNDNGFDRGGGGLTLATWLVGALAGSAGLGVILTYFIYRTRRPA